MKIGIALAGGGSKGSYEVGVWKALRELGIRYDIVTGTSIGAVNGALMVMGDYERAENLWKTISAQDIMHNGMDLKHDMDYYFENRDQLLTFAKDFASSRGADITPYKERIAKELDEEAFFASPVDYAAVTARFPSLQGVEAHKSDMEPGTVADWILASSSCFPVFPMCEIDGQSYIDGGYADNLPVTTAFRMGAEQVIAVALKPEAEAKYFPHHPLVTHITPSRPLGPFLDFSREVLDNNFRLGYTDTMRVLGNYFGSSYAFRPAGKEALLDAARGYLLFLLRRELKHSETAVQLMLHRVKGDAPLTDKLFNVDRGDLLTVACKGMDALMSTLDYPHEDAYDLYTLLPELRSKLLDDEQPKLKGARERCAVLQREGLRGQIAQFMPGKDAEELLLATWRLYLLEQEP